MIERAWIHGPEGDCATLTGDHLRARGWTLSEDGPLVDISLLVHLETDETLPDTEGLARALAAASDGETRNMIILLDRRAQEIPEGIGDKAPWMAEALTRTLARDLAPALRLNTIVLDRPWLARGTESQVAGPLERDLPAAITLLLDTPAMTGQTLRLAVG